MTERSDQPWWRHVAAAIPGYAVRARSVRNAAACACAEMAEEWWHRCTKGYDA
ncbi:hypothetical protein [Streptomyces sp. NPDC006610]|uniref:hypothetical protein n=1 Tax=Streptomyces sp. NPDC006610 TaxID=3154584 RepID=UPI0033AF94E2